MNKPILAIDFGTSNSLVGAVNAQGEKLSALAIDSESQDPTLMRTLLYFPNPDLCFYGAQAITEFLEQDMEGRLFRSFKSHLPNQAYLGTVFNNRILTLENLIGFFLLELKKRAEIFLQDSVDHVVLGKPARYSMDPVADQFALRRMQKSAELAGFKQIQFVPEPLAAAFDYRSQAQSEKTILVGDFGGGTSDFTIMKIHLGDFHPSDVLAIEGCSLAGDSLDSIFMANKLNEYFGAQTRYRLPMSKNILTMPPGITQRLNHPAHIVHLKDKESYEFIKEVHKCSLTGKDSEGIDRLSALIEDNQIFSFFEKIEATKKELSQNSTAKFHFSYPDIEVEESFSVQQFNQWAHRTRSEINEALERCLKMAGLDSKQIDLVCLTGGTSYVPLIRQDLEIRFGKEKLQTQSQFHSVLSGLVEIASLWQKGVTMS